MSSKQRYTPSPWIRKDERGPIVKHTPGPWYIEFKQRADGDHHWRIGHARQAGDMSPTVTSAAAFVPYCCGPEQKHNAHLVAAAPELFQACAELFEQFRPYLEDEQKDRILHLLNRAYS